MTITALTPGRYAWAPYQAANSCVPYGPAGAQALMVYLEDWFPGQISFGICNCRDVRGGSTKSHHAECRAYDEGFVVFAGQTIGIQTLYLLGPHGDRLGIDHLIMNFAPGATDRGDPRIFSAKSPQGRTYTGAHPHKNHDHIGLTRNAGRNLTYATLVAVAGKPNPTGGREVLYGIDIGKIGDDSLGPKPEFGVLQAFLIRQGYDLGTWGELNDGKDNRPGDDTRRALHAWKIDHGITTAHSAGEGKIGDYEMAAIYAAGDVGKVVDNISAQLEQAMNQHAGDQQAHPHGHGTGGPTPL